MRRGKISVIKNERPRAHLLLGLISIILLGATVICSVGASSQGSKLLKLEREIQKIDNENRDLRGQMITESSLTAISERAQYQGMVRSGKVIYLSKGEFVAKLP